MPNPITPTARAAAEKPPKEVIDAAQEVVSDFSNCCMELGDSASGLLLSLIVEAMITQRNSQSDELSRLRERDKESQIEATAIANRSADDQMEQKREFERQTLKLKSTLQTIQNMTDGHPIDARRRDRINELCRAATQTQP